MNDHDQIIRLVQGFRDHVDADLRAHQSEALRRDEMQAEVERRLEDLNHAHENAVVKEATFINREVFDTYQRERGQQMSRMAENITTLIAGNEAEKLTTERSRINGQRSLQLIIAGLALVIGAFTYHAQYGNPKIVDVPVQSTPTTTIP